MEHEEHTLELVCPDEAATAVLAAEIAAYAKAGDMILLAGDLGAGKTTFARAFIRAAAGDTMLEVPSPTFTILQTYSTPRFEIVHVDLYRVGDDSEVDEFGLDQLREDAVTLVEWPERATRRLHDDRLTVALHLDPLTPDARHVRLSASGPWAARLRRLGEVRAFLDRAGMGARTRVHLQGDASTRRYERIDGGAILMDAPKCADPGIGAAPPYSRIAHLAEDIVPFVAIARELASRGMSAPGILAADLDRGLVLLEDLGGEGVIDAAGRPIPERYEAAIDLLAALHGMEMPESAEAARGVVHRLPRYDLEAFLAEASLVLEWFAPHVLGRRLPDEAEEAYRAIWRELVASLIDPMRHRSWVLRDFHSPNLLWLPDRAGIARVGILDFQDAVVGPAAYDVASLITDARVDVPEQLDRALFDRYATIREAADPGFDTGAFARDVAIMTAQRNSKIVGIFSRLARRDGKPHYLAHVPRISDYLERAFGHPVLAPLKLWYDTHLPAAARVRTGG